MARWATSPMDRRQILLFSPTLDAVISEDHPVRLFDEILSAQDWHAWEAHYVQGAGQPPIHPRIVAGAILYGLSQGVRSSRQLERACTVSLDFLWLVEGRRIDHSTFCKFRTQFGRELRGLFCQIGRVAMAMGLIRLNQVALDGTKVQANSSRHATASASSLEARLAALDEQVDRLLAEAQEADRQDSTLWGESGTPNRLPRALADLRRRQERLRQALATAREKQARAKRATSKKSAETAKPAKAAKVPVADPDSTVQPNKEGGYAPNYVPMATVDGEKGMIVDPDVLRHTEEGTVTVATVDRIESELGAKPRQLLADTAHAAGKNLAGLAERDVEAFIPLNQRENPDNPARREDPAQPVAQEDWPNLPRNGRTRKLDRAAFVFDRAADCYYCPMGQKLTFIGIQDKQRDTGGGVYRKYRCGACASCPLATECVASKTASRTVYREEYEDLREAMDGRLRSEEGRKVYSRRKWIAETPFAVLKRVMGLRQFLLRGHEKVKTEWLWACTAFNLRKMVSEVARSRARLGVLCA
ncbi:MAG TPA: IS1182 family transposase [Phycisphaerae bacterium]|nr:IS1182 family transposase [Phycisphaerae bacterium]